MFQNGNSKQERNNEATSHTIVSLVAEILPGITSALRMQEDIHTSYNFDPFKLHFYIVKLGFTPSGRF